MKLIITATTVLVFNIVYGGDRVKIRLVVSNQNQPIVLRNANFALGVVLFQSPTCSLFVTDCTMSRSLCLVLLRAPCCNTTDSGKSRDSEAQYWL